MKIRILSALMIVGMLVASAGCSVNSDEPAKADGSKSDATAEESAASESPSGGVDPANVSPKLKKVPVVKRAQGGFKALTLGECATDPGPQKVTGTIESDAKATADWLVVVSWATADGDVMGRGFAVLADVAPGDSVDFEIKAKVKDGATQCVPLVSYGAIG